MSVGWGLRGGAGGTTRHCLTHHSCRKQELGACLTRTCQLGSRRCLGQPGPTPSASPASLVLWVTAAQGAEVFGQLSCQTLIVSRIEGALPGQKEVPGPLEDFVVAVWLCKSAQNAVTLSFHLTHLSVQLPTGDGPQPLPTGAHNDPKAALF